MNKDSMLNPSQFDASFMVSLRLMQGYGQEPTFTRGSQLLIRAILAGAFTNTSNIEAILLSYIHSPHTQTIGTSHDV